MIKQFGYLTQEGLHNFREFGFLIQVFSIRNQFISNLVLDMLNFRKLLEISVRYLKVWNLGNIFPQLRIL